MGFFQAALVLAAFLCSLVAGFLFAFAVVVMPGIGRLEDKGFIQAFRVIDGVIQGNQPIFVLVWLGSVIAVVVAAVLGIGSLDAAGAGLLAFSAVIYVLTVQLPTFAVNIPLNNRVQSLDVDAMDESALAKERLIFEPRWNRWNVVRTVSACLVSALLIVLAFRYSAA